MAAVGKAVLSKVISVPEPVAYTAPVSFLFVVETFESTVAPVIVKPCFRVAEPESAILILAPLEPYTKTESCVLVASTA